MYPKGIQNFSRKRRVQSAAKDLPRIEPQFPPDVSEKKKTSVELSGTLSEGKFKVKNIESTFNNEGIIKSEFIIKYSKNLSPDDQKKIESKLEDISGVKLAQVSSGFPFIIIETDLSMAHLKSKFNDNDFLKKHINKVTRPKETATDAVESIP